MGYTHVSYIEREVTKLDMGVAEFKAAIGKSSTADMLVSRLVEGMSYRQIAELHGLNHTVVERRIKRAIRRLERAGLLDGEKIRLPGRFSESGYPKLNMQHIPAGSEIPVHEGDVQVRADSGLEEPFRYCGGAGREVTPHAAPVPEELRQFTGLNGTVGPEQVYGVKAKRKR